MGLQRMIESQVIVVSILLAITSNKDNNINNILAIISTIIPAYQGKLSKMNPPIDSYVKVLKDLEESIFKTKPN